MKHWLTILALMFSLSVMAETVSYTITSRTSVRSEGDEPIGSYAAYEQSNTSGKVGQMTAETYTSLTLYGFSGYRIRSVSLKMHSNKTSGAGTLEMYIGDSCVWAIEPDYFESSTWYGEYTNSFVPIQHTFSPAYPVTNNQTIAINIDCLINSLYISSYTIEYDAIPTTPCTVHFATASDTIPDITEANVCEGIALPACSNLDSIWRFLGWTEQPLTTVSTTVPAYYTAGTQYYPAANTTLYALYADKEPVSSQYLVQDTTCQSGDYIIVDKLCKAIPYGTVVNSNYVKAYSIDTIYQNADSLYYIPQSVVRQATVYHIDFFNDSATIYNVLESSYISYPLSSAISLTKVKRPWNYTKIKDNMIVFYHEYLNGHHREWRATWGSSSDDIDSVYFRNQLTYSKLYASILFRAPETDTVPPHYTSYPYGTAVDQVTPDDGIALLPLRIHNPQLLSLQLYSLQGVCILTSTDEYLYLSTLPSGIYILKTPYRSYKIMNQ